MMLKPFLSVLAFVWFQSVAMAQGTHSVTDPELKLKTAQQFSAGALCAGVSVVARANGNVSTQHHQ